MKFNPQSYQRELLFSLLTNHATLEGQVRMSFIKQERGGIALSCFDGKEWKRLHIKQDDIDQMFAELRSA